MPDATDPRRVVLLAQYVSENSGSWVVARELARRLDRTRFRVIVLLPHASSIVNQLPDDVAVHYIDLPRLHAHGGLVYLLRLPGALFRSARRIGQLIRDEAVDVVHCNTLPNLAPALAARMSHVPLVWHVHELEIQPAMVFRALLRICERLSDRVVGVSDGVCALFGSIASVQRIYNGVDQERFRPASEQEAAAARDVLGVARDAFVVTLIARVAPIKGVHLFLDLARAVLDQAPPGAVPIRFLLLGEPVPGHEAYHAGVVRQMEALDLKRHVVMLGGDLQTRAVLAATDLLVQCSTVAESFGLTLVEAMSMGIPVLASERGGPAEIVRNGVDGYLIAANDTTRRCSVVVDLWNSPSDRRRLGTHGHARAAELFDARAMARALEDVYMSLQPCASATAAIHYAQTKGATEDAADSAEHNADDGAGGSAGGGLVRSQGE